MMDSDYEAALADLRTAGWRIEPLEQRRALPSSILKRYPWIPNDYRTFAEETKLASSPDDKSWLLTVSDFEATSDSAYAWNEWEQQSLQAAGGDSDWRKTIAQFWDEHLPILLSVRSRYGYFAIQRSGHIVRGTEPEYEETIAVASSFLHTLRLLKSA